MVQKAIQITTINDTSLNVVVVVVVVLERKIESLIAKSVFRFFERKRAQPNSSVKTTPMNDECLCFAV